MISWVQMFVRWVFSAAAITLSILWDGLPTHVLEVQQHQKFHVATIVSSLLVVIFSYYLLHGNLVSNITSRCSQYLFGNSKPALALIFQKISGKVVRSLFVPITLATTTVSLTYLHDCYNKIKF